MTSPEPTQAIIDDFVGNAHGSFARVKELLDQYPSLVNANASWNETALAAAAQTGQKKIAELLLTAGAPMDICAAAMLGLADRVREFLRADPAAAHAIGAHGIPVLYHAANRGNKDVAELLLAHGSDVNAGEGGNPALHGAVLFRQPHMAEWLLAHGARVNAKNYEGKTPLAVALHHGDNVMADLLKRHGGTE